MDIIVILLMGASIVVLVYFLIKKPGAGSNEAGHIKTLFDHNKEDLNRITDAIKGVSEKLNQDSVKREGSAIAISQSLKSLSETQSALSQGVARVNDILSNNQRRGQWGEKMLEDLLMKSGLKEGIQYEKQQSQEGNRPDFTLVLPASDQNKQLRLNIDSKFPLDNYANFIQSEPETPDQDKFKKLFITDVNNRIKEITGRGYIIPEETVDFVVVFFPNEAVYSAAIGFDPDLLDKAIEQRVILASPNTMYAVLLIVRQAAEQMHLQKSANELIPLIGIVKEEVEKYANQVERIYKQLNTVVKTFEGLRGTRMRALMRPLQKIDEFGQEQGIDTGDNLTLDSEESIDSNETIIDIEGEEPEDNDKDPLA